MSKPNADSDRQLLKDAEERGGFSTLTAWMRLSGPGWLQSAITLGGGSLAGALLLGALGGTSMLWLQLIAIIFGVIMLSAISHITLSTGLRPLQAINQHINPALGWGWVIATVMANIIWVMPQFGLSFSAIEKNLLPGVGDQLWPKLGVSAVLFVAAFTVVMLNQSRGLSAKIFDYFLKGLVGLAVISFFGVVVYLSIKGELNWGEIFSGFVPNLNQWNIPAGELGELLNDVPTAFYDDWKDQIVAKQRSVMIAAAATAVGINMTFLLPYSLLRRGWDKPFRGLARFDLMTGMAIPYILVTSCIVIAASSAFHAKVDEKILSDDPQVVLQSESFAKLKPILKARVLANYKGDEFVNAKSEKEVDELIAAATVKMHPSEKKLAASLVKPGAADLSKSLSPLMGDTFANIVFGIGVFAMGFSTIIILMLINGIAFREMVGKPDSSVAFTAGCLVSGVAGVCWPFIWAGDSKFWLTIMASVFGMMLLPIAYSTFFVMMNSRKIMGDEKPTGMSMIIWNFLMFCAVAGSIVAACSAVYTKATDKANPGAFYFVVGLAIVYGICIIVGFILPKRQAGKPGDSKSST